MTAPMIALLDNDRSFLSSMHDVLADEGYRTLRWCAGECEDAHALLRYAQPQLIILDRSLQQRDDEWNRLTRLRGDRERAWIPAIILSGQPERAPMKGDVPQATHCQVVRKPFRFHDLRDLRDLDNLLAAVERAIGRSPAKYARGEGMYPTRSDDVCVLDLSADPAHAMQGSHLSLNATVIVPN
ncbi:MAG: response regulator [Chloroflexota bacterium]|nr:response regulator [Chloroflexota bacterium]